MKCSELIFAILIDYSKAIDTIDHCIIVRCPYLHLFSFYFQGEEPLYIFVWIPNICYNNNDNTTTNNNDNNNNNNNTTTL